MFKLFQKGKPGIRLCTFLFNIKWNFIQNKKQIELRKTARKTSAILNLISVTLN